MTDIPEQRIHKLAIKLLRENPNWSYNLAVKEAEAGLKQFYGDREPVSYESQEEAKTFHTSRTGGRKETKEARYSLIPAEALQALAEVYGRGATKYENHNWAKGYPLSYSLDSAMRHLEAFRSGETYDPESGQHHLAHLAWHAFTGFIFTTDPAYTEFDDRAERYSKRPQADS